MRFLVDVGPLVELPAVNARDALVGALVLIGWDKVSPTQSWQILRLDDEGTRVMEVIAA